MTAISLALDPGLAIEAAPAPSAEAPEFFGHSYVDSQGAAWQEINLQALSVNSQFLSISA